MTVVPDSIEPVEEWRSWRFFGGRLCSHNGAVWQPGESHKAKCYRGEGHVWTVERGHGLTREEAAKHTEQYNLVSKQLPAMSGPLTLYRHRLRIPQVEPPEGYCYVLKTVNHDAPNAACSCGIYAGRTPADCPPGDVLGKVKLWGTIVPGTKGSRAEFAYPSELHVPARLAHDPALLAYGVPVVVREKDEPAATFPSFQFQIPSGEPGPGPYSRRLNWPLRLALAFNLAAGSANLALIAIRAWL